MKVLPVKLLSGRARLLTMPSSMGSPLTANRTGIRVTLRIARMAGPLDTARSIFWDSISATTAASAAGLPGE